MSKIKNGGLDQYGAEPLEQQQFGTAGVEGVKRNTTLLTSCSVNTQLNPFVADSGGSRPRHVVCHQLYSDTEASGFNRKISFNYLAQSHQFRGAYCVRTSLPAY